jgi:uncharacterized protein YcgL (UPF0745 family)
MFFKSNDVNLPSKKYMTHVIAGKLNNKPFLMVDCIGTKKENTKDGCYVFVNKLNKFSSIKDCFYTIAGSDRFKYAITLYDQKCHNENITTNFNESFFIDEVLDFFLKLIKRPESGGSGLYNNKFNRIYIIQSDNLLYYDIKLDENDENPEITKTIVENNHIIPVEFIYGIPKKIKVEEYDNLDMYQYCLSKIKNVINIDCDNFNIKNRVSYVSFLNNNLDFRLPFKNNNDYILDLIGANYCEL